MTTVLRSSLDAFQISLIKRKLCSKAVLDSGPFWLGIISLPEPTLYPDSVADNIESMYPRVVLCPLAVILIRNGLVGVLRTIWVL